MDMVIVARPIMFHTGPLLNMLLVHQGPMLTTVILWHLYAGVGGKGMYTIMRIIVAASLLIR